MGLLLAGLLGLSEPRSRAETLGLALPLVVVHAFMSLATWSMCRAMPLGRTNLFRLLGTHVVSALVSGFLWAGVAGIWSSVLERMGRFPGVGSRYADDFPIYLIAGTLLFLLSAVVHYLMLAFEASRAAERRALTLQVLAREAELRALRSQINPHFLFNALNSISALSGSDPRAARRASELLAGFLRQSLQVGTEERITLAQEVELARSYLAVEEVRFGPRLVVDTRVPPEAGRCLVPPLLLQPLVENAVVHGVSRLLDGGFVRLTAEQQGDRLVLAIENPRDAESPPSRGHGLGLANVRARLAALDPAAGLLVREEPQAFRVVVTLPAVESVAVVPEREAHARP